MELHKTTNSSLETEQLAEQLGKNLRGGEVIELVSDLGGGKTTFTRGLARGFGSEDMVSSPSFTLTREYSAGNKRIHHFDFYRLSEAGIMRDEIAELVNDPLAVVVVEWADLIADVLPDKRVKITLSPVDETSRKLMISVPEAYQYIVEGVA